MGYVVDDVNGFLVGVIGFVFIDLGYVIVVVFFFYCFEGGYGVFFVRG